MTSRFAVSALLTVACAVASATLAARASAGVRFLSISYNPQGRDNAQNINREYVMLKNDGSRRVSLRGWRVRDGDGHAYRFGRRFLGAGGTLVLHTGRGRNTAGNVHWGAESHVWDNAGETARLIKRSATLADRCSYRRTSLGYEYC